MNLSDHLIHTETSLAWAYTLQDSWLKIIYLSVKLFVIKFILKII